VIGKSGQQHAMQQARQIEARLVAAIRITKRQMEFFFFFFASSVHGFGHAFQRWHDALPADKTAPLAALVGFHFVNNSSNLPPEFERKQ